MSYYGFRFYDPNLQRWPNPDPIGEKGDINLYRFVANNPYKYADLLGFQTSFQIPNNGLYNLDPFIDPNTFYESQWEPDLKDVQGNIPKAATSLLKLADELKVLDPKDPNKLPERNKPQKKKPCPPNNIFLANENKPPSTVNSLDSHVNVANYPVTLDLSQINSSNMPPYAPPAPPPGPNPNTVVVNTVPNVLSSAAPTPTTSQNLTYQQVVYMIGDWP